MVTAGATQGLHLVSTVMFDKSTPVFMEDPSYFIALKMLKEDFGMNIIPSITDCILLSSLLSFKLSIVLSVVKTSHINHYESG